VKSVSDVAPFGILILITIFSISPQLLSDVNVYASDMNMSSSDQSMTTEDEMSADGTTRVEIDTSPAVPTSGQSLLVALSFTDSNGNKIQHQNYAITVTQGDVIVLDNQHGHTHTGNDIQTTDVLTSSSPVDIKVTLNGVGLPNTDPSTWTGPKGDVISFNVVPEFGSIAPIVLAIAVISIVVFTAKNRVIPKL
jgi:predicted secreted protein with PEFG-CTERM motif